MTLPNQQEKSNAVQVLRQDATSLCPECARLVGTEVIRRDGAVYFRKHCPDHGTHEALLEADADWYVNVRESHRYPPKAPPRFVDGCQAGCGMCVESENHTCFAITEITTRCNMSCPICYMDCGKGADKSLSEIDAMLNILADKMKRQEMPIREVQISGGEPTIHAQFLDVLDLYKSKGLPPGIQTNGRRFVEDPNFTREVAKREPWVYVSFDTFREATYEKMRGTKDWRQQTRTVEALVAGGIKSIGLMVTAIKGVNDNELGDILRYALSNPRIGCVNIFPAFYYGRFGLPADTVRRSTVTDVMKAIETQTGGLFKKSDFYTSQCTPGCAVCALVFRDDDRIIYPSRLLDSGGSDEQRPLPDDLGKVIEAMAAKFMFGAGEANKGIPCDYCSIDCFMDNRATIASRSFGMMIHGLMDRYTFDPRRASICTLHYPTPNGRLVPFCTAGIFGCRSRCV